MESPPIKPPRGVKTPKETSGLLMSVIRSLSATETNEQRDREKAKLDSEFKACDKRLGDLVQNHEKDLTQVITIFSTLSQQVIESREKIRNIKKNLHTCKTLLHCKRDDLKKLWVEGLEYKYMLELLEKIERMHEIPVKLQYHLGRKEYLHATKLLVESSSSDKDSLESIEGIKELKIEIEQKKDELHVLLLNELKQQIYVKTSQHVLSLSRQNSQREAGLNPQFRRSNEYRASARRNIAKRLFQDATIQFESKFDDVDIERDVSATHQEGDPSHLVIILVKCLAMLNQVPYAIDVFKTDMKSELMNIAQRTTLFINDFKSYRVDDEHDKASLLVEFLQTLFEQMKQVAHAHSLLLKCFQRVVFTHKIDVKLYDMSLYWTQAQFVIQNLLHDYLDIQNIVEVQPSTHFISDLDNLSSYFSRRKQQQKKGTLFSYENSSSALSMSSTLKENSAKQDKILVCTPDMNNILPIFIPLRCFVEDAEELMGLPHGSKCTLHQFISGYVTNTFLKRKYAEIKAEIENSIQEKDAWKATILLDVTTDYKPLLVSVVNIEKILSQWRMILRSLPMYAEHIVRYTTESLKEFRDTCHAAYQGMVQPHTEDRRICSAAWLKDDDISRFLKSLPNWVNLKAQQESHARIERKKIIRRELTVEEESPEDIKQRNRREAEILAGNLGEGGVAAGEILSDMTLLKQLAQLQESMEWFSVRMLQFASEFRHEPTLSPSSANNGAQVESVSPVTLQQLTSVIQDFDELANTCLLLLHLEVRVQCFHYLLAVDDFNKETHEPDPKVLELSKVLANVDEAMTSSLHPRKCKYIFEGLGHLIAKILITSTQSMQVINDGGIERMCRNVFALQQTLTNITMTREVALDHARHYFELFFLTPEEILNGIVEKGQEFSELEYMNAFQLLNRSKTGSSANTINIHLERLSDILGEVGVTV